MEHGAGPGTLSVVHLPDSPDARLFIELCSHGSDLTEARHALDLAIQGQADGSPLAEASPYLTGFAVVAYCRTILNSNVRRSLTEHIEIPSELQRVHEQVRLFRNATIAHSQSELAVTYPLGVLDPATLEVSHGYAVTMTNPLPLFVMHQFHALIEAMVDRLDAVIEPVRARLEAELRQAEHGELIAGARPDLFSRFADDFNPRSKRSLYPRTQTFYWNQQADETGDNGNE